MQQIPKSLFACSLAGLLASSAAAQGSVSILSVTPSGVPGNGGSHDAHITPDGRFVAFTSLATNLIAPDLNPLADVFVLDRLTGALTCASVDSAGMQAPNDSGRPSLAADGQRLAFSSTSDLAPGATPIFIEVFVRDFATGTTVLASPALPGQTINAYAAFPSMSADGRWVAFESAANNLVAGDEKKDIEIFLRDLQTQTTLRVTHQVTPGVGNGMSLEPVVSGDGRYVAYQSFARLTPDDSSPYEDVFLYDRATGTTTLVTRGLGGQPSNASSHGARISADGRWVSFASTATNFVPLGDTPGSTDAFLYEVATGVITRLDIGFADGPPNQQTVVTSLSSDGRYLGLETYATNVFPGDDNSQPDALIHHRVTGATILCSRKTDGWRGNGSSRGASVADDGKTIAFTSAATDLVPGDFNGQSDVFLHERIGPTPVVFCTAKTNGLGCLPRIALSGTPSLSSPAPFTISASEVVSNQVGLLFYGFAPALVPFQGGLRCVQQPVVRTAVQLSGGTLAPEDCSGSFAFDFNLHLQSGSDPMLVVGTVVYAQFWSRDPFSPSATSLTDAAAFEVTP